jgi:hypothetical protein
MDRKHPREKGSNNTRSYRSSGPHLADSPAGTVEKTERKRPQKKETPEKKKR